MNDASRDKSQGTSVLLLGAGSGKRLGEASKAFTKIQGVSLFERAIANFKPFADEMLIGVHWRDLKKAEQIVKNQNIILLAGGQTRADTMKILLDRAFFLQVLLHDVARPFVDEALIRRIMAASLKHPAVALCTPLPQLDRLVVAKRNRIIDVLPGTHVYKTQTPIICRKKVLLKCLAQGDSEGPLSQSIVSILFRGGCKVHLIPGNNDNIKITYPDDRYEAERIAPKYPV
jgi:2-C-methyl-D-erythritol 4-phosphate cytidylyltransferase